MDANNRRPAAGGGGEEGDWRSQLHPGSRQRIVDKITETLKRHLPFSGQEGLQELKKIAVRFEEKIYTAASSQPDYLQKISLKMLTMENKSQNTIPNSVPGNAACDSNRLQDTGASHSMPSQAQNHLQSHPPSQAHQQQLSQNVQNNMAPSGVLSSDGLTFSLPSVSGITQSPMADVVGLNSNMQNMPSILQASAGNQMGQAVPSNVFPGSHRQMQQRQQVFPQQQQTETENSQYLYQQQLQQQLLKAKFQPGNPSQSLMQMQSAHMVGLQQYQPLMKQQLLPPQQQQLLMGWRANLANMQQNEFMASQNIIDDMMQQQQRLLQQNNVQNLQQLQQQLQQQEQLMAQQNNLSTIHQRQLGPQNNVVLQQQQWQQQLLRSQSGNSGMPTDQHSVYTLQQSEVPMQQQSQAGGNGLLASQGQQLSSQVLQQQFVSQTQSSAIQLQHRLGLQQQSNPVQRDLQQTLQGPREATGSLPQPHSTIDQRNQLYQSQRALRDASASLEPAARSGQVNLGDWQEEAYQKVKQMKDAYHHELTEMYQKIAAKLQQHESMSQQPKSDQLEKLKMFKQMVERLLHVLQTPKNNITPAFKDKLGQYEKQILSFLNSNRPRKPMQHGVAQPHIQNLQPPPPSHNERPFSCPICFGPLVEETSTRCGHIFCQNCIKAALAKQPRCPVCRKEVVAKDLIRVFLPTTD